MNKYGKENVNLEEKAQLEAQLGIEQELLPMW